MAAGFGGNDAAELRPHTAGIQYVEHTDGAEMFKAVCKLGLEGLPQRSGCTYRSGLSKNWIKVENPKSPTAIGLSMGPITPSSNRGAFLSVKLAATANA